MIKLIVDHSVAASSYSAAVFDVINAATIQSASSCSKKKINKKSFPVEINRKLRKKSVNLKDGH